MACTISTLFSPSTPPHVPLLSAPPHIIFLRAILHTHSVLELWYLNSTLPYIPSTLIHPTSSFSRQFYKPTTSLGCGALPYYIKYMLQPYPAELETRHTSVSTPFSHSSSAHIPFHSDSPHITFSGQSHTLSACLHCGTLPYYFMHMVHTYPAELETWLAQ